MSSPGAFRSLASLTGDERYRRAGELHFKLEEAVSMRVRDPRVLGGLVEARLRKREDFRVDGYAEMRTSILRENGGGGPEQLVRKMADAYPEVADHRQALLSLEMEALMDQSYAEPLLRRLYEQALSEGKEVTFSEPEAYNPVFRTLLLEKNGFDRFRRDTAGDDALAIRLTAPQARSDRSTLAFSPAAFPGRAMSRFPRGEGETGPALAAGWMEQRLREREAASGDGASYDLFALGYCLLGPGMVLLLQSLQGEARSVIPRGRGSGFLTTTGQRLGSVWPGFPVIGGDAEASLRIGLFPGKLVERSLLPESAEKQDRSCLVKLPELDPVDLLLPPLRRLFMASTEGSSKPMLQAAAAEFVMDYAEATRGICLPLPKESVLLHWRKQLLDPDEAVVAALLQRGPFTSARIRGPGLTGKRLLRSGCWPSATYLGARPWRRKQLRILTGKRCAEIEAARAGTTG